MTLSAAERFARLRLARTDRIGPVAFAQLLGRYGSAVRALGALPDLVRKVEKAKSMRGTRFLSVLIPCLDGWGLPDDAGLTAARYAVECGAFPLYEIEDGTRWTLNVATKPRPRPRPGGASCPTPAPAPTCSARASRRASCTAPACRALATWSCRCRMAKSATTPV